MAANGGCRPVIGWGAEADSGATATRREGITGAAFTNGNMGLSGSGQVTLLDSAAFSARYSGAAAPVFPSVAAVVVAVRTPSVTREILTGEGVAVKEGGDGNFWVPPEAANGAVIAVSQA